MTPSIAHTLCSSRRVVGSSLDLVRRKLNYYGCFKPELARCAKAKPNEKNNTKSKSERMSVNEFAVAARKTERSFRSQIKCKEKGRPLQNRFYLRFPNYKWRKYLSQSGANEYLHHDSFLVIAYLFRTFFRAVSSVVLTQAQSRC